MRQHLSATPDRRSEPRKPQAFAFWLQPAGSRQRSSAWMLDMCSRGAAVLVPCDQVPAIGQRVRLIEMQTSNRLVRETTGPLPAFGRVLRHDEPRGSTRRIALRFEADVSPQQRTLYQPGTVLALRRSSDPTLMLPVAAGVSGELVRI